MADNIITKEATSLADKAKSALDCALEFKIDGPEMYELSVNELQSIKGLKKQLLAQEKSLLEPVNETEKRIRAFFSAPKNFLIEAETIITQQINDWRSAQERLRVEQENQRRLAQKKLDDEAAAERQRVADEARAEAQAKRDALNEQIESTQDPEQAVELLREQQAIAAEASQKIEQAAAATPVAIAAPTASSFVPKVSGAHTREYWTGEVVDLMELVKAIAAGEVPPDIIEVKQGALNKLADLYKASKTIPGVKIVREDKLIARAR